MRKGGKRAKKFTTMVCRNFRKALPPSLTDEKAFAASGNRQGFS